MPLKQIPRTIGKYLLGHRLISKNALAAVETARLKYADAYAIRAAVQVIPYVGGPMDTLLAGRASSIQLARVGKLVDELSVRLENVEAISADPGGEEFADLVFAAFEKSTRTRSDLKRSRFAQLIVQQLVKPQSWEESEDALRLLSDLEDLHVAIIAFALRTPLAKEPFESLRAFCFDATFDLPSLTKEFPQVIATRLRLACSELVARGLLDDEGLGRFDLGAMEVFVATDVAEWFGHWIATSAQAAQ